MPEWQRPGGPRARPGRYSAVWAPSEPARPPYGLLALALAAIALIAAALVRTTNEPRLVGYGCQGAGGPLYAMEESDFPLCERIEQL